MSYVPYVSRRELLRRAGLEWRRPLPLGTRAAYSLGHLREALRR